MKFVVYGTPIPQGSKTFRGFNRAGRPILAEDAKGIKPWRENIQKTAFFARKGAPPLDGPLIGRMVFTMPKPKSAPKRRRTYPSTKPDLSKLLRAVEDSLKQGGVIADDARIVGYSRLWKTYPNEDPEALDAPGVRIEIVPVEEATATQSGDLFAARAVA